MASTALLKLPVHSGGDESARIAIEVDRFLVHEELPRILEQELYQPAPHHPVGALRQQCLPADEAISLVPGTDKCQPGFEGRVVDVLAGHVPGRTSERDITLFKSLGMVSQDLLATDLVLRESVRLGIGTLVEW